MATNVKILSAGSTSSLTATDLYVPASPKTALINSIVLESNGATNVLLTAGVAGSLFNCSKTVFAAGGSQVLADPITLGAGEKLQITLSAAATVNYAVMGIERD
ncbi:MAG TPA: hypothetical protein DCM86_05830 [Verrucomicrobiales bacterium]|nr:hypothetical protein [Verrucomicrobiales bacterium]